MYSEYRIHPARLTLLAACRRLVVVRSRLNCHTKNGKRRLAGPVRLYMYDCTLYFQTRCPEYTEKYSIQDPPVNGVCRGDPGILQDPHNVFKGIKLVYYSVLLLHIVLGSPIGNMFLRRTNPECVQSKS